LSIIYIMNYSLSPASIGGRTRRRRGGEVQPLVIGGRRQRGGVGEGENGDMVVEDDMIGAGYKQRGGIDGAVEPVKGEGVNYNDKLQTSGGGYMMPKGRRQRRRESRRQSRRQRKGGENKSRSKSRQRRQRKGGENKSRSKSRQRR